MPIYPIKFASFSSFLSLFIRKYQLTPNLQQIINNYQNRFLFKGQFLLFSDKAMNFLVWKLILQIYFRY